LAYVNINFDQYFSKWKPLPKECMHNDNEYDQENELNDRFHGNRFSR
jgi:hypothetical protein